MDISKVSEVFFPLRRSVVYFVTVLFLYQFHFWTDGAMLNTSEYISGSELEKSDLEGFRLMGIAE